jgi:hypothetical protein
MSASVTHMDETRDAYKILVGNLKEDINEDGLKELKYL